MPPATGSTGFLAVTVTTSGLAKASPVGADCGVVPAAAVRKNPWLWKAPMSTATSRGSPRWSVARPLMGVPAPRREAAGQKRDGLGQATVVV